MRRFLGANLNINTTTTATESTTPVSTPTEPPLSSTKRAFQNTLGALAYSRSNSTRSARNEPVVAPAAAAAVEEREIEASSPVPPTPPSKHGHAHEHEEEEDNNDSSWDDALKLPFSSSLSRTTSAATSASASSASSSSHDGAFATMMIGNGDNGSDDGGRLSRAASSSSSVSSRHTNELEYVQLNTLNNRTSTATISASRVNANGGDLSHSNDTRGLYSNSNSNSTPTAASRNKGTSLFSPTYSQMGTSFPSYGGGGGLQVSNNYTANASSLVDLKDEMMLELLSSDALLHVAQFEILGFDEVEELRKEHSILQNRLQSLTNKLRIETKIRDAALSISKLYANKRLSLRQKQAAEEELSQTNKKVDNLTNEYNKLSKKEGDVRMRIERHMAAVLALSFRKLEGRMNGAPTVGYSMPLMGNSANGGGHMAHSWHAGQPQSHAGMTNTNPSSAASSHTGPFTPLSATFPSSSASQSSTSSPPPPSASTSTSHTSHLNSRPSSSSHQDHRTNLLSPNAIYSPTFSTSSASSSSASHRSNPVLKFEGPHLYANNKDAFIPGLQSTSSSRSPSLAQIAIFSSSVASSSASASASRSQQGPNNSRSLSISSHKANQHNNNNNNITIPPLSPAMSTNSTTLGYMDTSIQDSQLAELNSQLNASKLHSEELVSTIEILQSEKIELSSRLEELSHIQETSHLNEASLERTLYQEKDINAKLKNEIDQLNIRLDENLKDASLWEDANRKTKDEHENMRRELNNLLAKTLRRHAGTNGPLSKHLPDQQSLQTLDVRKFISQDLDVLLSSLAASHSSMSEELVQVQRQLTNNQQTTSQASSKTAEETLYAKRQIDELQQEKQMLLNKLTRMESENSEIHSSLKELSTEHDSILSRYESLKERFDASSSAQQDSELRMSSKIQEVDKVHSERMFEKEKLLLSSESAKKSLRGRLENLQNELNEFRVEKNEFVQGLISVWKELPTDEALKARLALGDKDDIMKYKAIYLNPPPSTDNPIKQRSSASFSPDKLGNTIKDLLLSDNKIISRLAAHEDHASAHKASAIRAEKLLKESKTALQEYSNQVKDLAERIEKSDEKEIQYLEQLNDLTNLLEITKNNAKKAEVNVQNLIKKCVALETEKESMEKKVFNLEKENKKLGDKQEFKNKIVVLEKEIESLKEELASAQDELDELRSRESRQRVQLLDELTQLTEEASSLRAQLRTAQRKLAAAGK